MEPKHSYYLLVGGLFLFSILSVLGRTASSGRAESGQPRTQREYVERMRARSERQDDLGAVGFLLMLVALFVLLQMISETEVQ
ncbi:MAG: hypothetical protein AAF196_19795 [Planctomycetota bacterium]